MTPQLDPKTTSPRLRVLHLEDDFRDRELVAERLAADGLACEITYATTLEEFERALGQGDYDVILSDFTLPSYDGMAALATTQKTRPEVPFLFVSGTIGVERAVVSLKSGATDYVLKSQLSQLAPAVRRALREAELRNERKQAAEHIRDLNLLLRGIRDIGALIVREREPQELLTEACAILVRARGYSLAWIGLAEPGSKRVVPIASAGKGADYLDEITVTWDEAPTGLGPVGRAMKAGRPWVCHDTSADPQFAPWQDRAQARGFASLAAVPMIRGASVLGAVTVYADRTNAFPEEEVSLLNDLADDLAFALQSIEHETERQRADEELRLTNNKLNHLLAHTPAVIYTLRIEGSKVTPWFVSDNIHRLLGVSAAEAQSYDWWLESLHPEDRDRVLAVAADGLKGRGYSTEYRVRRKDGAYCWVGDNNRVVRDAAGQPTEAVGAWIDITERKRLESEILLRERRFNSFFTGATAGLVLLDKDLRFLQINETLATINGLPVREHLGRTVREVLPKLAPVLEPMFREVLTTGKPILNKEVAGETPSRTGAQRHWMESFFPIFGRDGNPDAVGAVVVEITEHKKLEEQFRQAQKMEGIGQLAGGVAHDFNNLLAVIRGNAELVMMDTGNLGDQTQESLKQIIGASERAANLTRQLLTFSRKQVMQSQPLKLNELIADLAKMLDRIIGENIDLQCQYSADLPLVQADAGLIEQVLVNLVVNARDAMPSGGQLRIATDKTHVDQMAASLNPEARAGEFVCLTVTDTGTGIAADNLPRIFEPFFTTKEAGKGTGLGLATVYGIVKQHQGWVEVSSQAGAGATFKMFLPASPLPARATALPQVQTKLRGGHETILLVEDEPSVRFVTRRALESYGYEIVEASSGREALEVWPAQAEEIALLLTDIVMTGNIMGQELAERLRAQATRFMLSMTEQRRWIFCSAPGAMPAGESNFRLNLSSWT